MALYNNNPSTFLSCASTLSYSLGSCIQLTAYWIIYMNTQQIFLHPKQNSWPLLAKSTPPILFPIESKSWDVLDFSHLLTSYSHSINCTFKFYPSSRQSHVSTYNGLTWSKPLPPLYWTCRSPLTCLSCLLALYKAATGIGYKQVTSHHCHPQNGQ